MDLKGRSFLTLLDFNKEEIRYMLDLAHELKAKKKKGILGEELKGKNIVLVFDKSSTRTRCSFEVAAMDEGAHVTYLTNSHMNKKESIEDTAKVFGRMYDAIEYRGFGQDIVEDLQKYSGVPVWNGLTDVDHPTQVLADFLTMEEHIDKKLDEMKLTFVGDLSDNVMYEMCIRDRAYRWMADFFCIPLRDAHIGHFNEYRCEQLIQKCEGVLQRNARAS